MSAFIMRSTYEERRYSKEGLFLASFLGYLDERGRYDCRKVLKEKIARNEKRLGDALGGSLDPETLESRCAVLRHVNWLGVLEKFPELTGSGPSNLFSRMSFIWECHQIFLAFEANKISKALWKPSEIRIIQRNAYLLMERLSDLKYEFPDLFCFLEKLFEPQYKVKEGVRCIFFPKNLGLALDHVFKHVESRPVFKEINFLPAEGPSDQEGLSDLQKLARDGDKLSVGTFCLNFYFNPDFQTRPPRPLSEFKDGVSFAK